MSGANSADDMEAKFMKNDRTVRHERDFTVFDGRLQKIKPAILLLCVLAELAKTESFTDGKNVVLIYRDEIRRALNEDGKTVSDRTVKGWLSLLALNGAIKYKIQGYNGRPNEIFINPSFAFTGTVAEYAETVARWREFGGDVAAARPEYTYVA